MIYAAYLLLAMTGSILNIGQIVWRSYNKNWQACFGGSVLSVTVGLFATLRKLRSLNDAVLSC